MHLKFLPYKLEESLNDFKGELLFIEVEQYHRKLIFEHLAKRVEDILEYNVNKVELGFDNNYGSERLTNVWLYLNENSITDVVKSFEVSFNEKAKEINKAEEFSTASNIQFYWLNKIYVVGIGVNPYLDNVFVYIAMKHNSIFTIKEISDEKWAELNQ